MKDKRFIYHYTSSDAFVSMIHKDDNCPKELAFWASDVYYMNDTKEMTILYDELIKILPKIEKDLKLSHNLFSEIIMQSVFNQRESKDSLKNLIYDCIFREVYVISFSDQGDTLPMWSMYGKNGNGLCLVFDIDKVNSFLDDRHKVREVYYSLDKDSAYSYLVNEYRECYNNKGIAGFLVNVFFTLCGRVKNPAYSHEQEFRFVDHVVDENDLIKRNISIDKDSAIPAERLDYISEAKVRVQEGLIIPYKEVKIPLECLSSVIVGPSANQKLQYEGLRILLKGTHLNEDNIILSDIPYRT